MLHKNYLLGVGITNATTDKILKYILTGLKKHRDKMFISTPNPEILVYANKHPDYKHKLNTANIALPDGVGVFIAAGLLGNRFKERITGVDFIEVLCQACKEEPLSMGFLGGRKGVAQRTAECLKTKYPWIMVVFAGEEWPYISRFKKKDDADLKTSIFNIQSLDILFVAFGFPKQEEWICENIPHLPVKAAMGVGGAFDYISGEVIRAPFFIRALGFEWLFRLIRQPWRIKRQYALVEFVYLVLREHLFRKPIYKQINK